VIASLRGFVLSVSKDFLVLETQGGVGYTVLCSKWTLDSLKSGEEIFLWIESVIREESWTLVGFLQEEERRWFRYLTSVQGIGNRVAIALLSQLSVPNLCYAIIHQNKKAFVGIEGVGPKIGARLLIELEKTAQKEYSMLDSLSKDGLSSMAVDLEGNSGGGLDLKFLEKLSQKGSKLNELSSGLRQLGYKENEIYEAFLKVQEDLCEQHNLLKAKDRASTQEDPFGTMDVPELLGRCLRALAPR
jgi:Holliday junction DNA helicase RuvA subunit